MEEAEILADRVAIINGGKIIAMGTLDAFLVLLTFAVVFREWISISLEVLALLIIAALNTISIGLLISSVTRTERTATEATSAITWPISFITGIFFPSFLPPEWMRSLGDFFPASALLRELKEFKSHLFLDSGHDVTNINER